MEGKMEKTLNDPFSPLPGLFFFSTLFGERNFGSGLDVSDLGGNTIWDS
jgi:hypothetical protein